MKNKYLLFTSMIAALLIVLFSMQNGMTFSSQAPPGNTGSPGDGVNNTCAKSGCHVGTVNSGPGDITIDVSGIPSRGWLQGKTYRLKVIVAESFVMNYGFQLVAENPVNNTSIGSLSQGGNSNVVVSFTNWISHKNTSAAGNWEFDWTAPTGNEEEVTFYATGNAANGNGNNSGDHIYKTNVNVKRDMNPTGITGIHGLSEFKVLQNPVMDVLRLKSIPGSHFSLYSMTGEKVKSFNASADLTEINVSELKSGMYILLNIEESKSERIIIK